MKRIIMLTAFAVVTLCVNAQFVLTPSAGLMTEDGPYIISREGSEVDNYEAAKKAVQSVISDAEIGDVEYEKSFNVSSAFKDHRRLPGALIASDWTIEYTLLVECSDGKILVSFKEIGALEAKSKGELVMNIYPTTGKNSMMGQMGGRQYLFNSKGKVASGCKKIKVIFEDFANDLVKNIENNLK